MSFVGVEEPRVDFSWISASEGSRFADTIRNVTDEVKALGPKKGLLGKRGEAS
jgi:coenzyme F420-reducing hydrogenase delta subunit